MRLSSNVRKGGPEKRLTGPYLESESKKITQQMPGNVADTNGVEVKSNGVTPAHPAFDSIPDVIKAFGTLLLS